MYLKELGLHGFKSFPDKVKLEFNKGITAVVGPNGSGKSNISDAVRWVLGEQRVKNLRGDRMEDVIFAGTDTRKRISFAEVSLTLDNEDEMIPLNFSEITVKRTVFRSGESKYTINGTPCRLKDINELFMDTGVGREGYSIIGQGRIDEILSTKSEDRRRLFEEAAGIAKYRTRRIEAMGKLEKEHDNLVRIDDIITEIEAGLEPLRIQNENARQYLGLKEKLKKCEITLFLARADKIETEILKTSSNLDFAKRDILENEKRHSELDSISEALKNDERELSEKITALGNDISADNEKLQIQSGNIRLIQEQISNYEDKIKRTESDFKAGGLKAERLKNEIGICQAKKSASDVLLAHLYSDLDKKESEFDEFNRALDKGEEKLNLFKNNIFEKMRSLANTKTEIENRKIQLKQLTDKKGNLENTISVSQGKYRQAEVHVLSLRKKLDESVSSTKKYKDILVSLKNEQASVNEKLLKAETDYRAVSSEFSESVSKYRVLSDMKNDFEGYYKSVKCILKEGISGKLKGIHGAVGELIKSDSRYEVAIETALGSAIQNIVTEDEYTAKAAIEYLKRENLGRATFMPVSVIRGRVIEEREKILNFAGVCGIASDIVSYSRDYSGIVSSLLGRVIVVENMDCAIKLSSYTGRKYRIVTLGGDVINPGGAMTGGSISKKSSGIFSRSREIDELERLCRALKVKIEELKSETADLNNSRNEINSDINDTTVLLHKLELEKNSYDEELKKAVESLAEIEQGRKNSEGESVYIKSSIAETDKKIAELESEVRRIENEIENTDSQLEKIKIFVDSGKGDRDKIIADVTAIKVSISSAEQERTGISENILRLENELKEAENENKDFSELKNEYLTAIEEKKAELFKSEDIVKNCRACKEENEQKLKELISVLDKKKEKLEEILPVIHETYEIVLNLKNMVYKYQTRLETLNDEKEKLYSSMWEEYEVTYHQAKDLRDSADEKCDFEKAARELRSQIKNLGNVNVNAIEEYSKTKERYDFLTSQRDDIRKAEDNLMKIIDDLEILMREQFASQFNTISENFNDVFKEMFGGGRACLRLSDSADILESGIEIIAQPPGKTMQNMLLLSGGERALTAIAILFAILKMKPSPFCILDEIEAALDDANVKRFANYLKRFSSTTQFIVISHRKGTMEAADALYGVTMQEKGISKVLSVKFEDLKDGEE